MQNNEATDDAFELRFRRYQELRARMNLPPPVDEATSRNNLLAHESDRAAREARGQQEELEKKRLLEEWLYRVLATHEGVSVVRKRNDVFRHAEGEQSLLPPPHFPYELNDEADLTAISQPVAVDGNGYAWTREPVLAFFSDDGSRLTVHWIACAHEPRYGWEFSHAIVQRATWGLQTIDDRPCWLWIETIERPELSWGSSTAQWTSLCQP